MAESQSWWSGTGSAESPQPDPSAFESKQMQIPDEGEPERPLTRRVHILGLGSIGTLIAHSLQCLPNPPPITLMLHKPQMYEAFKSNDRIVRLKNLKSEINDERTGFDVDLHEGRSETGVHSWRFINHSPTGGKPANPPASAERMESGEIYIYSLIVTVKGPATVQALHSVKHRVNAQTTICLIQNGLGQVDELNREVFTDPATRPTYMLGIISHGVYMSGDFCVVHAGFGTVALGIYRDTDKYPLPPKSPTANIADLSDEDRKRMYPTDKELYEKASSLYMLRTLTRSPVLACAAFPYLDLFQLQLEKLSSNALLNPLTALLNVPNGAMLNNRALSQVQRLLLAEISLVIRSLPELEGLPNVRARFSPKRLEYLFLGVTAKTAENSSSMREDMRKSRSTEIDYINGYIVKRGEELGLRCVLNYMMQQLVRGKTYLQTSTEGELMPYGVSQIRGEIRPSSIGKPAGVTLEDQGTPAKDRMY